jgi:serine phosphatase RsbU (regulator of sigma subunit)/CHASE1-domain containing sensor protein
VRPKTTHPLELSDTGSYGRLARTGRPAAWRQRRGRRQARVARLWLPVAVVCLALGPIVAYGVYRRAEDAQQRVTQARFEEALAHRAQRIAERIVTYEEVLHACQGLFDASKEVTREEFVTFTRQARGRHPGIRLIAWAPRVPEEASDRYPILYVDPRASNAHRLGRDIAVHAPLAETLARALAAQGAALSDPPIEPGVPACAFLALAVSAPGAQAAARERLGAVLLSFCVDDLVRTGLAPTAPTLMTLELHDAAVDGRMRFLARTGEATLDASGFVAAHVLSIGGQDWILRAAPTAWFLGSLPESDALGTALLVFLAWELFGGLLLALGGAARSHAVRRQGRTVSRVLQSLGEGVVVAGGDGRVRLSNEAAHALIGESADHLPAEDFARQVRFRTQGGRELVGEDAPLSKAMRGVAFDARELCMSTPTDPDGTWVSVTSRPLRDEWGQLLGGVLVLRDVGAQRRSARALRERDDRLRERQVEMDLAAEVQQRLYPARAPEISGLDIAGAVYPADETCGDYYDYLQQPDGSLCLAVGDVSGHGLGPALVMAEVRASVHMLALGGAAPEGMLKRINAQLCRDLADDLFVTMVIVNIASDGRTVSYASAGHTPALLISRDGELKSMLGRTGLPLGMFEDRGFEARNGYALEPEDVLVLMTDGATEAASPDGAYFGEDGVLEVVRRHRHESADAILAHVKDALHGFSGGALSRDDVTLVVCKGKRREA